MYRVTFLVIAWVVTLSACSSANFAYNSAPGYISDEFEDAFDLNSEQTDQLDARIDQFFTWHRKEELSRYQTLLDSAALDAENGISADEFLRITVEIRDAWNRSMGKVIDSMGGLATTLNPEQIEHFKNYYQEKLKDGDDYFERSPEERCLLRAERSLERLEDWYGNFDNALEARLLARLHQLPNAYEPWIEYRQAQVNEVIKIFASESDSAAIQAGLRHVLLDPEHPINADFEPTREAYWRAFAEMVEEINGWLTPEHQQNAVAKLQKFARLVSDIEPQS